MMGMTTEAPSEVGPLLEESGKHCSHLERQEHHGLHRLHLRARVATAIIVLAAVVALALLVVGGSGAGNSEMKLVKDRGVRGFINYNAEVKKIVKCRFQFMVDEHDIGQVKPTEDGLEYATCITDDMEVYYLLVESTKDLLPGVKVTLTLEEVTHQSTPGGVKFPWERHNMPLYKVLGAPSSPRVARLGKTDQVKEMTVLTILCKYDDYGPDYITERQAELDLFATPSDVGAGRFHGSMADMTKLATYGKVILPRSKAKTVTVQMGSKWGSVTNCPIYDFARQALQKVKEQHPSINPDDFTSREFFLPNRPTGGCDGWGGRGALGCAHPSVLPNPGGCMAWYRVGGSFIRAHELGHNLGLMHGGGNNAGRGSTFVEYGDPTAAMGASYRFSSYIASSRFFLGVLGMGGGGVVDWSNGADKPLTLGSKSLPLGQAGAEAVAIRMRCSTCVPKVSQHAHKKGGYIWVSFRGDEGYSAIQNRGLEERFQNKVYVHLARDFSNPRFNQGSELWKVLKVGESYRPANLFTIYVCSIVEDLAKVTVGSSHSDASSKCGGTLRPLAIRWATHPDKCLDVSGGVNRDGTNVQLWDCLHDGEHDNMQFLVPPSGTGRIHWAKHPTKCLDVSAGNTNNGANLQIWSCNSMDENPNMQFLLPSEQGTIRWATHKNKCLDVSGGETATGTNIQMWECDDNDQNRNMQFTLRKPSQPLAIPIRWATHPGKCLDVSGGLNRDGTNVQLWDCVHDGEHDNMQFLVPPSGTGRIHWAKHPTKCLDVSAGNTNNGANLQIWSCDNMDENPNMQFLLPSEQGTIRWATHRNKCIDVAGGGTTTGTNIQMWECDDNDQNRNMQFTVRKPL